VITLHPSITLRAALQFAASRGMHLVYRERDGRIAAMPDGQRHRKWRRLRTGVKRIAG